MGTLLPEFPEKWELSYLGPGGLDRVFYLPCTNMGVTSGGIIHGIDLQKHSLWVYGSMDFKTISFAVPPCSTGEGFNFGNPPPRSPCMDAVQAFKDVGAFTKKAPGRG